MNLTRLFCFCLIGAVPSGCWCPLTRQFCNQRTSFIHSLIHYENLYEAPTLLAERVGFEAGRNELQCPPLALVGHMTQCDLPSLNFPPNLMRRERLPPNSMIR